MIREIAITNLGVIESTSMAFDEGLTVLTGETGAGKTLITTALSQLLGAKADAGLIRHGASEATIDCSLDVRAHPETRSAVDEIGAAIDDGELLVSRTLGSRSRAVLGGRPVAASVLGDVVGALVTLHGQHGQTRLTKPSEQRAILDATDDRIRQLLDVQRDAWSNLRDAVDARDAAVNSAADASRDLTALQAFAEDVASVSPTVGEDSELDARINTLASLDAVLRATRSVVELLTEGDEADVSDVRTLLGRARRAIEQRNESPDFAAWAERLVDLQEQVQSLSHDVDRFADSLDADPAVLDSLMQRRALLGALMRRWNLDLAAIITRYEDAQRAIALARDPAEHIAQLEKIVTHCAEEQERVCTQLHDARTAVAASLSQQVAAELHDLGLVHAEFRIDVTRLNSPSQHGDDEVVFQFSANPGQPLQPLASVGSGGELSRVMLALETATATTHGRRRTFIFDEVDAGVGGKAALELGRRLADLARTHQVVVVTHLAQVAAFADRHIAVEKAVTKGQTTTTARALTDADRPRELARLLSGIEDSQTARAHAEELLATAASARLHSN